MRRCRASPGAWQSAASGSASSNPRTTGPFSRARRPNGPAAPVASSPARGSSARPLGAALVGLIFALTSAGLGGIGRGATLALLGGAGFAAAGAVTSSLRLFGFRQVDQTAGGSS